MNCRFTNQIWSGHLCFTKEDPAKSTNVVSTSLIPHPNLLQAKDLDTDWCPGVLPFQGMDSAEHCFTVTLHVYFHIFYYAIPA